MLQRSRRASLWRAPVLGRRATHAERVGARRARAQLALRGEVVDRCLELGDFAVRAFDRSLQSICTS